jgi:hypothetical protein
MSFTTDHVFLYYLAENLNFPSKVFRIHFSLVMEDLLQTTKLKRYIELLGKKKYSRIRRTTYPNSNSNPNIVR